jgi:hypothetical protein
VVFRSLMISIDQRIITERQEAFSEPIGGVLLYAGEHLWGSFLCDRLVDRWAEGREGSYALYGLF